ncbi:hypothetical protein FRB94_002738 [Tulasnella sp. JGI-2019a]|nr:hypothetical protein FRB94_002738 [Tulasnella sp. JGI-2019a]KAG9013329.1 hypothetical protein FRB93_000852 [Tulasnella sp. JGI-2019a]KAG9032913.1 hypothetical protein FRB95_000847 [Tulasnella sp. JGI-2019a]
MATKATTVLRSFNNGNKIPWIGFGTGTALYSKEAAEPVFTALSAGFTHIDGAEAYGNEDSIGIALQRHLSGPSAPSRESIFITTKLYKALEPNQAVRDRLKVSLGKLQVDYVDLYLLHTPIPHLGKLKDMWKQMEDLQKEGLAKNIGVSNFRVKDFEQFISTAEIIPVCNQIEFNPYLLNATDPIFAFQEKYGIMTVSFGGLNPIRVYNGGPIDAVLPIIRERYSKDLKIDIADEQILTKWTLSKGVLPITTSSKKERLELMLRTAELPDLQQSEVDLIDQAGRKEHHRRYQLHMDEGARL